MLIFFGVFSTGISCYYCADSLKIALNNLILVRARGIIKHELKQPHVLDLACTNLKNLTIQHVFKNEKVVKTTAGLLELLFQWNQTQDLATDLIGKALIKPGLQRKVEGIFDYHITCDRFALNIAKKNDLENKILKITAKIAEPGLYFP